MNTDPLIKAFVATLKAAGVPVRAEDNSPLLEDLERRLPKRLPQSLECFMSGYSFPGFDLGGISLFGWSRDVEANEYFSAASAAKGTLSQLLLPAGYMQIGRPHTDNFDAVCIDLNGKAQNRENPIVRADHEEMLYNRRVRISDELWPSFRSLVASVLAGEGGPIQYE